MPTSSQQLVAGGRAWGLRIATWLFWHVRPVVLKAWCVSLWPIRVVMRSYQVRQGVLAVVTDSDALADGQVVRIETFERPEPVRQMPPICLTGQEHWMFSMSRQTPPPHPSIRVMSVAGGRACGAEGAVVTPEGNLVREFSGCFFAAPDSHPLMYRLAYPKPEDLPGTTAVLGVPKSDNYYHWLFDVLPRLRVVREALGTDRIDRYLVDHRLAFQRETLEVLGIPVSRCIQPSPTRQYRCEHMIVPSLIRGISSTSVSFLRSTFLDAAPASRAGAPDRIYLTRHNCARRRVLNKDEVAGMLADRGFAIVDPGSLSFREQVALFSRVSTIVAPHGGSLTNLVFCRPGTRVVECFSPRYVNRCYWMLSNAVGIRYAYLLGQGRGPAPGRVPLSVYEDMRIDVDALDALIRKVDEVS